MYVHMMGRKAHRDGQQDKQRGEIQEWNTLQDCQQKSTWKKLQNVLK